MRQLHIRAQSGPRPVTAAAVRALLADGSLDPTGPVLSLDAGRTWQPVNTALAVIDGLAVDDTAVDHALRVGPLHPIAMPLGAVAIVLLTAGISFGGGSAGPAIRETPGVALAALARTADAGLTTLGSGLMVGEACLNTVANSFMQAGMTRVTMPAATTPTPPVEATGPALLADWRQLLGQRDQAVEAWQAAAEALGKRTTATGLTNWNAKLVTLDVLSDENRERLTASLPGTGKALRLARFEVDGGAGNEHLGALLLVEDPALATTCDELAKAGRDLRITAQIASVSPDAGKRTATFQGTLTAAE